MNQHWHYLEQEMALRREIYNRELAEARCEQQRMRQHFKAVTKAVQHFTSRGVKVMTALVRRKVLSTFKR
jgi:hypothetical protein